MTEGDTGNPARPWAIALVHGIGTTSPLPMIQEVGDALRTVRPDLKLATDAEVHEVHEPGGVIRHNVIRHGSIGGTDVRIGTAHWADITFYRRGLANMIGALMMTAFGVRFFAQVASRTIPGANWLVRCLAFCLRHVLQFMVQFLALVIFPVTLVSLVFSCMGLLGEYVFKVKASFVQKEAIALLGLVMCVTIAAVGWKNSWEIRKERPLSLAIFSLIAIYGAIVATLLLIGDYIWLPRSPERAWSLTWHFTREETPPIAATHDRLPIVIRSALSQLARNFLYVPLADRIAIVDRTGVYFALLHVAQIVAGIVMISLTLIAVTLLAILLPVARLTGTRIRTFVFATVSVISIWIINLILLWPENLATFAAMTEFLDNSIKPKIVTITTIDWLSLTSRSMPLDLAVEPKNRTGFMLNRYYRDTYPLMWFETAFLIFLFSTLILVLSVLTARAWWCRRQSKADLEAFAVPPGAPGPRLNNWPRVIISRGYVILVLMLIVAVPYILFALALHETEFGKRLPLLQFIAPWLPTHEISVGAEWARFGLIVFLLLFALFSHYISAGAKLVLDVVNHFTAPAQDYPVRHRIARRFEEMIDTLLQANDKPDLVIISHSQGTVITLDALLRDDWIAKTLDRVSSLTVVTFGSPITHVYQEYFPRLYPKLSETSLSHLSLHPKLKWFNVYRIDDYVGTYIDPSIRDFPINIPAPRGGHTDYWQQDVLARLFAHPWMHQVLVPAPRTAAP
jgi:hypothetical protein